MKIITLPLVMPLFNPDRILSDSSIINRILEELEIDFEQSCNLCIYENSNNWEDDESSTAFSFSFEYGKNNKKTLIEFDVDLNDLEMFANSLMKSIEMIRRDYSEVIKHKIKNGSPI